MSTSIRRLYLSFIGAIFLIANLSYYTQYPGLLSSFGIEPAATPLFFHTEDVDSWIDLICIVGVCLSCIVVSGICQHGLLCYWSLTTMYYILIKSGSTFFQFQWDMLLVEVGFVTGLCYAPWTTLRTDIVAAADDDIGSLPIRFLLFKLMFMSGVVKIQANCPTWLNLTALEYHFASQCLPGPLAWHAHQLHPLLLRLSVLVTLIIEIPSSFLLLAPIYELRWIGVTLQIALQVMIVLTGNYNFFNLLTMAMCLPCLDDNVSAKRSNKAAKHIATFAILCLSTASMCQIEYTQEHHWHFALKWDKSYCDWFVDHTIPIVVPACVIFTTLSYTKRIRTFQDPHHRRSNLKALFRAMVCCYCIGMLSIPMLSLTASLQRSGYIGSRLFASSYKMSGLYRLSSGYGLFRRMTGVGTVPSRNHMQWWGWAGLEPSVVQRPEIILEAQYENQNDTSTWHELDFRWKPGNVNQRPLQVAPHQPRLDWQMWFAALGSYHHNSWFLSFLDKLLENCPPVLDLVQVAAGKRIVRIRSQLYHYDFTRLPTRWNEGIPGVTLLGKNQSWMGYPDQIWARRLVREYTPALERGDRALKDYLSRAGYAPATCWDYRDRCHNKPNGLCRIATIAREWNFIWVPVLALVIKIGFSSILHHRRSTAKRKEKRE
jgi:hypothetical protein